MRQYKVYPSAIMKKDYQPKSTIYQMKSKVLLILLCSWYTMQAQSVTVTLDEAIQQALQKNKSIEAATWDVEYQQQLKRTALDVGKTSVVYMRGQYNSYTKDDNNITVSQSIPFPTVFTTQQALHRSLVKGSELRKAVTENDLVYQVKQVYHELQYLAACEALLKRQDSIYTAFVKAADLRYRTGEARLLEKTTAETQHREILNLQAQVQADILIYQEQLQVLINSEQPVQIGQRSLTERTWESPMGSASVQSNPELVYFKQQTEVTTRERKVASARFLPDITVGYFNQTLIGTPVNASGELATKSDRFQGFEVGLAIPLWFGPQAAKVKAASMQQKKVQAEYEHLQTRTQALWQQAVQQYTKNRNTVNYYKTSAVVNAELILKQATIAFRNGEIGYTEYWLAVRNAMQLQENYLRAINALNQSVVTLEFLAGTR
jgi:cobalt-zinc-cadmium resistance protein CzcA